MTADEFVEDVIYPATSLHPNVVLVDPVFDSGTQAGLTVDVEMETGEVFRLSVARLPKGLLERKGVA